MERRTGIERSGSTKRSERFRNLRSNLLLLLFPFLHLQSDLKKTVGEDNLQINQSTEDTRRDQPSALIPHDKTVCPIFHDAPPDPMDLIRSSNHVSNTRNLKIGECQSCEQLDDERRRSR
jgi:hypothetical protein